MDKKKDNSYVDNLWEEEFKNFGFFDSTLKAMFHHITNNIWILSIGLVFILIDLKLFLFYFFFLVTLEFYHNQRWQTNYYNQLNRNQQVINRKITAICRHLKISKEEFDKILRQSESELGALDYDIFKKEIDKI